VTRGTRKSLVLLGAALLLAGERRAHAAEPEPGRAWTAFESLYGSSCEKHGIVGSAVAVVKDGRIVARATYGDQELATHRRVDDETIFHWASITKTFTGIAVMQLRDRGLLKLDDPVVKYLPELRQVHDPFGDVSDVTIRHLMTHSAGFRAPTWPWGGSQPWHPFEPTRYEQLVAMLPYTEVLFRPGSRHRYSNLGVVFLGRIIEQLTGDDYEVYVDKNILKPLEMHRSYFDRSPYHLLAHRSHGYVRDDQGLREEPFDFDTGVTVSNGGLMAPIGDMAKYLAFLLGRESARRAVYEGVLKRASLEEMWQPQLKIGSAESTEGGAQSIGLSFFLETHEGRRLVGHSGNQGGFIAHIYVDPEASAAYVIAFNTDASSKTKGESQDTRALDAALRTALLATVLPRLP
jgi:CubicO group peptidase (beta-lactamase class C family)